MLWPEKNSYKEFDNEEKFLRLENYPPPHNFSNGPSLMFQSHMRFCLMQWSATRFYGSLTVYSRPLPEATEDGQQFRFLKVVLNNKTRPLFLEFN